MVHFRVPCAFLLNCSKSPNPSVKHRSCSANKLPATPPPPVSPKARETPDCARASFPCPSPSLRDRAPKGPPCLPVRERGSRAPLSLSRRLPGCAGAWRAALKRSLGREDSWRTQVTARSGCGGRGDAGRERDKARSEHAGPGMPAVTVIPVLARRPCSEPKPQAAL